MSVAEIIDIYSQSFSVLDIELNIQSGLTMRTFETLGAGLKLITTNKNIQNEPFYNQHNIAIIDRLYYNVDLNFFSDSFLNNDKFVQYSFKNWCDNLFKE